MRTKKKRNLNLIAMTILVIAAVVALAGCSKLKPSEPTVPSYKAETLSIKITGGPDKTVPYGSIVTFRWEASGGTGRHEYRYRLDSGDFSAWTSATTVNYVNLASGGHQFEVKVKTASDAETQPAQRTFKIGELGKGDTIPPTVNIITPREGFKAVTNSSVVATWEVSDQSNSIEARTPAEVVTVAYAIDDTSLWEADPAVPLSGTFVNLLDGSHTIYVKAIDRAGNATVATRVVTIQPPTILYVDEEVLGPGYSKTTPLLTAGEKFLHHAFYEDNVLNGFAYEVWNVAEKGYPSMNNIPKTITTILWVGSGDCQNSSWGWNEGWAYSASVYEVDNDTTGTKTIQPTFLTEFMDAGGKVWIIGENFLDEINFQADKVAYPKGFENLYLHLAADSSYAGGQASDIAPTGSVTEAQYPSLSVDAGKWNGNLGDGGAWDIDNLFPGPGAEVVYQFSFIEGGAPVVGGTCSIRYPAGGSGTRLVFFSFPLYYFSGKAAQVLGHQVLGTEFGN